MENFLKQIPNPNNDDHHNILHGIKTNIDLFKISFISLGNSSLGIYVPENYNLRIEGFLSRLLLIISVSCAWVKFVSGTTYGVFIV